VQNPQVAFERTVSVMHQQEELVHGIVKRMTRGMDLSADAYKECIAEGRLGLFEPHGELDRKHRCTPKSTPRTGSSKGQMTFTVTPSQQLASGSRRTRFGRRSRE
jgi:hypothetical protein